MTHVPISASERL